MCLKHDSEDKSSRLCKWKRQDIRSGKPCKFWLSLLLFVLSILMKGKSWSYMLLKNNGSYDEFSLLWETITLVNAFAINFINELSKTTIWTNARTLRMKLRKIRWTLHTEKLSLSVRRKEAIISSIHLYEQRAHCSCIYQFATLNLNN